MTTFAYLRTSSMTNVGEDRDSEPRQRAAVLSGAERLGHVVATDGWFYDQGVSGDVPIDQRPAFMAMLDVVTEGDIVIVESADRFARKMLTAELGILLLIARKVRLLTSTGEDLTDTTDEMRIMFRQIAMSFAQLEKTRLCKKLAGARDRASLKLGRRCEGQKGYAIGVVTLAKSLRGSGMTLTACAAEMQRQGFVSSGGLVYSPSKIKAMVDRDMTAR